MSLYDFHSSVEHDWMVWAIEWCIEDETFSENGLTICVIHLIFESKEMMTAINFSLIILLLFCKVK